MYVLMLSINLLYICYIFIIYDLNINIVLL